jgi:hypothetical protein
MTSRYTLLYLRFIFVVDDSSNARLRHRFVPLLNSSLNVTFADPHSLGISVIVQVLFRIVRSPLFSRHFGVLCYCCPQIRLLSFSQLRLQLAARLDGGFGSGLFRKSENE